MRLFGKKKQPEPEIEVKTAFISNDFFSLTINNTNQARFGPTLTSALNWFCINVNEADLKIYSEDNGYQNIPENLNLPLIGSNQTLEEKLTAVAHDLFLYGNALAIKLKNGRRQIVGIQYVPWRNVFVQLNGANNKIEQYTVNGTAYTLDEVIHFRSGVDESNYFLGLNKWNNSLSALNDLDINAAIYQNALVTSPAPSAIIVSKKSITQDVADRIARTLSERATLNNAGKFTVLSGEYDFIPSGLSPDKLNIGEILSETQTKICSILGLPPAVLSFHTSSSMTYQNYNDSTRNAILNLLIPTWEIIADTLTNNLQAILPEGYVFSYKWDHISNLQADLNAETDRVTKLLQANIITQQEARAMLGIDNVN